MIKASMVCEYEICIYDGDKSASTFSIDEVVNNRKEPIITCNCVVTNTRLSGKIFKDEMALSGDKQVTMFVIGQETGKLRLGQEAMLTNILTKVVEWGIITGIEILSKLNCVAVTFTPRDSQSF